MRLYKWGQAKRCVAVVHYDDGTFYTLKEGTQIDSIAVKGTLQQAIEYLLETYRAHHATL